MESNRLHPSSCRAYKFGHKAGETGRDGEWREMVAHSGFIGVSCAHLEGGPTASWIIEIDTGCRGEPTGKTVNVEAGGFLEC